jgi:hypothetical protein
MSRQNKVNPGQYTSAGRLSPDDLGRERQRQAGKATMGDRSNERPAWETSSPSSKGKTVRQPGRMKVAAARTVIGVTRATAGAVKAVTGAAKRVVGTRSTRPSGPIARIRKIAKAPSRTRKAPARAARTVKRR